MDPKYMTVKNFIVYIKTNFDVVDAQKLVKYYDSNNCNLVQKFPATRLLFASSKSSDQQIYPTSKNP